jgi:hypothetical protein
MFLNQMESGGEGPCFVAVGAGGVADDVGDVVMAGNTGEDGVSAYTIQTLVELYGGCMAVLKVSWCGIRWCAGARPCCWRTTSAARSPQGSVASKLCDNLNPL